MSDLTTMILRFRDLSTNSGQTIKLHREKIKDCQFTWWGWWHKAHETVPVKSFHKFNEVIKNSGPIEILLFDTGRIAVYKAMLEEIVWEIDDERGATEILSPDPEATPKYYEGRTLLAWVKITEIGKIDKKEDILRKFTYVKIEELFKSGKSEFNKYYGKQIYGFEELKNQERTIWFVRPYSNTDLTGAITEDNFTSIELIHPDNFSNTLVDHPSARLLWLSDIHFSKEHHAFPLKKGTQRGRNLAEAIRRDLEMVGIRSVGGILVTGDLTWASEAEEFEMAGIFLDDVMSWSTLKPKHVVICPGNHDLPFSNKPWEKGKEVPQISKKAKEPYEKFYQAFYGQEANEYLASGRRFLLKKSVSVEIASLNSSYLLQTPKVFQGSGYVGDDQLQFVQKQMEWGLLDHDTLRPFRIMMMHHHLVPVIPYEIAEYGYTPSIVYDSGDVCNWVEANKIDLVLHGHMHHTKVVKESRAKNLTAPNWHDFVIASLGSELINL